MMNAVEPSRRWLEPSDFGTCEVSAVWELPGDGFSMAFWGETHTALGDGVLLRPGGAARFSPSVETSWGTQLNPVGAVSVDVQLGR